MQYLVRVTIHNGTGEEYAALHKQMEAISFHRYVRDGSTGKYSVLPDATYIGERAEDGGSIRDAVSRIAATCAPAKAAPEVFVTLSSGTWWSGLRQAA
ncbi:hypothetical protein SAMN05216321_10195 [Cupriavidus sp. OV038]|jgi:hypothetical protein|uniref:hypothetical protein n=1 Tax=unclassified Cupriavidus TaxID=2640874 RepID=UPI0008EA80E2|nr:MULTISPECIES: hypothetical protein [unclassified Cupriavidus]SFB68314.1 hypothetical protein SAMN05216321_10195 [Cupriavidus sp. OV038]SFO57541.1 hypothetical protein SAMN05216322_10195 [Cupriavidus sp. OV096]